MKEKEELNFEETMKKLEEIVQELENGELNLDDSIKKFEEGMKISKDCNKFLEEFFSSLLSLSTPKSL